jgi:hypothetical protein
MLVNHMIRVHNAIIRLGDGLDQCFSVEQLNAYQNGLNKSARTFIGQMDMLKRYQSGNEQSIHVQNVSVSDGGQAIVGNVNAQPAPIKASEPPPALTDAKTVAMPIIQNNDRSAVPATPKSKEKK